MARPAGWIAASWDGVLTALSKVAGSVKVIGVYEGRTMGAIREKAVTNVLLN